MLKNTKRTLAVIVSSLGLFAFAVPAHAGQDQANLAITASVSDKCIISTSPVAFGAYDPIVTNKTSDLDAEGSVTVTCTNGASATILLGQGANAALDSTDTAPDRQLLSGTDLLRYLLFSDPDRQNAWGNTSLTGVADSGNGSAQEVSIFGRIPAGQNAVHSGSYSDTVVATVTF